MRLEVILNSEEEIVIPIAYNYYVQSLIYNLISNEEYADFLHNKGYRAFNRKFKLFSFSKIEGDFIFDKESKMLTYFKKEIKITITSPNEDFIKYILETLFLCDELLLCKNRLKVQNVKIKEDIHIKDNLKVYTLSPIVVSSTLASGQTVYYSPLDHCFSERIKQNILKKYSAFKGKEEENINFNVKLINRNKVRKRVSKYKGIMINGYMCELELSGDVEILKFAYDACLGEKNSQGFGVLEVKK